jgi:hypothetical protein
MYESLAGQRANFDNTAQEIIDNLDPHHRDILGDRMPGEQKNYRQFDGTALYASQIFADFYQGSVFNQNTKWFSIDHANKDVNNKPENRAWLNTIRDIVLTHMRSFYGPGGQAIGSWVLFGNGPVLCEELPNPKSYQARLKYTSVPWGQWVGSEGDDGKIDKFIRTIKLPANQIYSLFPDTCSDDIRKAATSSGADMFKMFDVLHSIMPRDMQAYSRSKIKSNKEYDFESCWVEKQKKVLLKESGYRKFPVAVARYRLISGEVYARGLGEVSLPDGKSLNLMDELSLLKAGRELDPPMLVRRNSIIGGILDQRSKGKTIVSDINNSVKPLIEGSNWPVFQHMQERKTQQIMRVFHVDEILHLLSHETPELTAFEVNARLGLLQQILGPVFGQNDLDFFNVILDVTVDNLAHMVDLQGQPLFPAPPNDMPLGKDAINFVFEGPQARAQKNQELINIQQSIADVGGMQPLFPEVVVLPDWEAVARRTFELRGTQDLLHNKEQFDANVKDLIDKQNQAKQQAAIGGAAQALGQAAPALKVMRDAAVPPSAAAA